MRIAITGVGVISPYGIGLQKFWSGTSSGKTVFRPITRFDASPYRNHLAGEIPIHFNTGTMPRAWAYAQEAAREAVEHARWTWEDRSTAGVILGTNFNGQLQVEHDFNLFAKGERRLSLSGAISEGPLNAVRHSTGLAQGGPGALLSLACSSGAAALGVAMEWIQTSLVERVLVGGFEALSEYSYAGLSALRAMSRSLPRPFDVQRDGPLLSEGAAIFAIETEESLRKRRSKPLVWLSGYGLNNDAYHLTAPQPEANGIVEVMRMALKNAGLEASDIDHVNLHGTATRYNDESETKALHAVFGERAAQIPVTANKSLFGHAMGAAGALEAAATVMSLREGLIPPTMNIQERDKTLRLDVVTEQARSVPIKTAMSNSYGLGGSNASLIFTMAEE